MNEEPSPIGRTATKKNERRTPPPNGRRHIPALPKRKNTMISITSYISELKNQLELLHSDTCPDPLETQERLFHLLESLQSERESLQSGRESLPPAVRESRHPAENDAQGMNNSPLATEAELCLLELEAHAELLFSTPALRCRLPKLLERAQTLLSLLPAANNDLRQRLEQAFSFHLPVA